MVGTRKFRMGQRMEARRAASAGQGAVLTAEDSANLDAFGGKLTETIDLLRREITAITAGQLNVVSELYEQKADLLKWLELKMPLVEPFLTHEAAKQRGLPDQLKALKEAVAEDSALLARMASAAGSIVREIEKATQRHSLNGLYGKSGQKLGGQSGGQMRIDREF